jgi:prolyl-tRNA synthetase
MGATFTDEDGAAKPFVMGCYGIGVTRTVAAAIEQHHDKDGIIWPLSIAPYHIELIPMNVTDTPTMELADRLYDALSGMGIEVLLDDRDERPGVKFKDADLVGIPIRVVIGSKGLAQGKVELKRRGVKEVELIPIDGAAEEISRRVRDALKRLA